MRHRAVLRPIRDLIALVDGNRRSEGPPLCELTILLDRLALVFDETTGPIGACGVDHPSRSYDGLRSIVSAQFPELGFYNIPARVHDDIADTSIQLGDGVDDLSDIVRDLEEVVACAATCGSKTAMEHLRFVVRYHIGEHLADLRWAIAHLPRA